MIAPGTLGVAGLCLLACAASGEASNRPAVKVGTISSDGDCAVYETSWGSWLVLECRSNFPDFRDKLQSAIAESGKLALSASNGGRDLPKPDYVVTGRITGLGVEQSRASDADYCVGRTTVTVSVDLRMRDAGSGAIVYGGTVTKSVEVGSHVVAGDNSCSTNAPSRTNYENVQREAARAAARALAFHLAPLRVEAVQNRKITLNYGKPTLPLGAIVQVVDSNGALLRFRVTGAMTDRAVAEPMGSGGFIESGAAAEMIENDDPAANGRRFEKVELPL